MVNRRTHTTSPNNHYDYDDIDYYDDDYNDDYDYYRSTDYNDDNDAPSNYDYRGTAIYHYDNNINDYNPRAYDDYSGTHNDDDDNYYVHFATHHDHYVAANDDIATPDDSSADDLNINIYIHSYTAVYSQKHREVPATVAH